MSRPLKNRIVSHEPTHFLFGPLGMDNPENRIIALSVDEYECLLRLDVDHLTQIEVAKRMGISRSSVQRIYASARTKTAKMLVEGIFLQISGGAYSLRSKD